MPSETRTRPRPSSRTRYRYLLFGVEGERQGPARADLIRRLRAAAPPDLDAWLTRYDGHFGILRVPRDRLGAARLWFDRDADVGGLRLRALLASGTIAGLERKHAGARSLRRGPG